MRTGTKQGKKNYMHETIRRRTDYFVKEMTGDTPKQNKSNGEKKKWA